ncbi:MAG TPA: trypsin-like peptidase domain-containing protein, partial [Thermoanaerobaculia bacterium]|nr:trypsin-like peptidase domain-containing protein [Thermoanaerobaculia bacterium]
MDPELEGLVQSCCARLKLPASSGTAFFVAPQLAVTARHVVEGAGEGPAAPYLSWNGRDLPVEVVRASTRIDAALLRVRPGRSQALDHPCVFLEPSARVGDGCYAFGFSDLVSSGEPLTVEVEGSTADGDLKLKQGQVRPGFSGAPLFNQRTAAVCGLLRSSRGRESDLGGRAVTAAALLAEFPELVALQRDVHAADPRWISLRRAERRQQRLKLGITGLLTLLHAAVIFAAVALTRLAIEPARALFPKHALLAALSVGLVPGIVLAATQTAPLLLERWRRRRLVRRASGAVAAPHAFFRIGPYEETAQDIAAFRRNDGQQEDILAWLQASTATLHYVTGGSGTGKSSLMRAFAVPRLRQSGVRVVTIRTSSDPVASLLRVLAESEVTAAVRGADASDALQRLVEMAADTKVVVVFDQFEEFLIVNERSSAISEQFLALAKEVAQGDGRRLAMVLVLRAEYQGIPEELGLPPLRQDENWKEVPPFSAADAVEYLRRSGLGLSEQAMEDLVGQLAQFEGTPGLVRPITVNMAGLVMAHAGHRRQRDSVSRLLLRYVRDAVVAPDVKNHAPRILSAMLTRVGTRLPVASERIARETGFESRVVTGCLLSLSRRGLVRRVDDRTNTWEIAHD